MSLSSQRVVTSIDSAEEVGAIDFGDDPAPATAVAEEAAWSDPPGKPPPAWQRPLADAIAKLGEAYDPRSQAPRTGLLEAIAVLAHRFDDIITGNLSDDDLLIAVYRALEAEAFHINGQLDLDARAARSESEHRAMDASKYANVVEDDARMLGFARRFFECRLGLVRPPSFYN